MKPSAVKETSQATPLLSAGRSQPSMAREETRGVTRMGPERAYYAVIWVQKVVEQRPCRPAFEYLGPSRSRNSRDAPALCYHDVWLGRRTEALDVPRQNKPTSTSSRTF